MKSHSPVYKSYWHVVNWSICSPLSLMLFQNVHSMSNVHLKISAKTHGKLRSVAHKALVVMLSNTVYMLLPTYATLSVQLAHKLTSNCFVHILHYIDNHCSSFTARKMLRIDIKTITFRLSYQSR